MTVRILIGFLAIVVSLDDEVCAQIDDGSLNFLIVTVDDMGCRDLGCYGSRYYETPELDAFAKRSLLFSQAYAACAVCSPSRASLMTGRYPTRLGITNFISYASVRNKLKNNRPLITEKGQFDRAGKKKLSCPSNVEQLPLSEQTLAELLGQRNYVTAHFGKWHLGHAGHFPEDQGFDINIGGCGIGRPASYFDPFAGKNWPAPHNLPSVEKGQYLTDRETEEVVEFIDDHQDQPFFVNLCHYAVHTPNMGKPELVEKYKTREPTKQSNPVYAAMVESVDQGFGRILDTLERNNLLDRTVIIFTSDNGGQRATSQAPIRGGKGEPYEGGIRIPQIIYWPRVTTPDTVCDTPVSHIDLFPTIAAAVKLDPASEMDGQNMLPLLMNESGFPTRDLFWHFPHYHASKPYTVVRHGDWKLIRFYEDNRVELYNLAKDPNETIDSSATNPDQCQKMDQLIEQHLADLDGQIPRVPTGNK